MMATRRWTQYAYPPYSYVTGKFPHPLREVDGHGCPGPPESKVAPTNKSWMHCESYLWGVDLYHGGFYWEAHEAWEGVWHAAGRSGPVAKLQKALIKLAAAGVKSREGRVTGVRRHAARATELAEDLRKQIPDNSTFLGVNLRELSQLGERIGNTAEAITQAAITINAIVLPRLPLQLPPDSTSHDAPK